MKLKRVIAKVLLGSMIVSFTAPFATINSYSYSVDTTYEDTTEKYEENIAVSIEPLEVPTVGVARYMMPFITEETTDLVTTEIETTEKEEELLVVYTTEYLNVRQEADQEAKKINTLPPNTELRNVTRVNNSWYSFDFEEHTYFISAFYVTSFCPDEDKVIEIITLENQIKGNYFRYKKSKKEIERVVYVEEKATSNVAKVVETSAATGAYTGSQFKSKGVLNTMGYRWTWYSQKVLPGGGLKIPGRYVDDQGYVCDENGYICLASCDLKKGTVINTPLGKQGKVYDYCPTSGTIDVYCNW